MASPSRQTGFILAALLLVANVASSAVSPGSAAPDFVLPSLADGNQRISDYRSEVVLVSFLSPGCLPCRESILISNELHAQFGAAGLQVLAVSVAEDSDFAHTFVKNYGIQFPVLLDSEQFVSSVYGLKESSMTVVLDQEGQIIYIEQGFQPGSAETISALVAELVSG